MSLFVWLNLDFNVFFWTIKYSLEWAHFEQQKVKKCRENSFLPHLLKWPTICKAPHDESQQHNPWLVSVLQRKEQSSLCIYFYPFLGMNI